MSTAPRKRRFVGPDLEKAIITLKCLQRVMDNRYAWLESCERRKNAPGDGISVITAFCDEIALYSTVLGTDPQQREFVTLLRDLVARGRAAAIIVIAAAQQPSVDIIPESLRDLYRPTCHWFASRGSSAAGRRAPGRQSEVPRVSAALTR